MSAPTLNDTLSIGYTGIAAERARHAYRGLLGAVLIVEAAAGVALLVAPFSTASLLDLDATGDAGLVRLAGVLVLALAALFLTGRAWPARSKLVNIIGMVGRAITGVLLLAHGGRLIWPGVAELLAALALAFSYFAYFKAEVMSRP